jgi:ribosomal protein L11 methyltransferase
MAQWEIVASVPAAIAEAVASVLAPLGDGLAIDLPYEQATPEDDPVLTGAPAVVRLYAPATDGIDQGAALQRRADDALQAFSVRTSIQRVEEQDWAEACRQSFEPQRVGQRLVVQPPWSTDATGPDDIAIIIEPGIAFGTGDHPTTRACLQAAERLVRPGARVLDVGCGSGILSVAALRLGAAHVLALDIDPLAVKATRENAERNGVADGLTVEEGALGRGSIAGACDVIFANIASGPLMELAPAIARVLAPGGAAVASGVIAERLAGVVQAFEQAGMRLDETIADGDWRTIVVRRA